MRLPGSGNFNTDEWSVYYSGEDSNYHRNGVGFIVSKEVNKCIKSVCNVSDRLIMIQVNSKPANINLVQVYAPTTESSEEVIENFYAELKSVIDPLNGKDITIVMGDLNAKIGQGRETNIVGDFGLGERKDREDRLVEFCREQLSVMNTFFKLPQRRLYTWISPAHTPNNIIRNQIDYITINNRYRNAVTVKTFPGADILSDHNLLLGVLKLGLKKVKQQKQSFQIRY